jgi:hypothetical protein
MQKEEKEQRLKDKLDIACNIAESRLSVIWNTISDIDAKINAAFGFASVILGILAGFYSFENIKLPPGSLWLFALATLAYIFIVVLSLTAYRIKKWSYRPDIQTLLQHCLKEDIALIQEWLTNECKISFDENQKSLNKKATLTNYILVLFAVETILLSSGLIYSLR